LKVKIGTNTKKTMHMFIKFKTLLSVFVFLLFMYSTYAQKATDSNTPLHLSKPDYKTPYGIPTKESIIRTLDRVHNYLESSTPAIIVDSESGKEITNFDNISKIKQISFK